MRYCRIIVILLSLCFLLRVDKAVATGCPISGIISTSCSWSEADSPVNLGSISIQPGVTVTIEPSVVVLMTTGDIDIYGSVNVNSSASIVATSGEDSADILVRSGAVINLSTASAISRTGSARINIDIYGAANMDGSFLNVSTFSTYPGSDSYIVNSNINASRIAFYKGSNYILAGNNVFRGGARPDTDSDGIPDGDGTNRCTGGNALNCDDNCVTTANADQADADGDKAGDVCDNCLLTPNPGQQDTNADGYGNICDCDLDNNNFVGPTDFNIFKNAWLTDPSKAKWNSDADFDSDNFIGPKDFNIFKTRWLKSGPWM